MKIFPSKNVMSEIEYYFFITCRFDFKLFFPHEIHPLCCYFIIFVFVIIIHLYSDCHDCNNVTRWWQSNNKYFNTCLFNMFFVNICISSHINILILKIFFLFVMIKTVLLIVMLLKYFGGETMNYVLTVHCYDLLFSHWKTIY